MSGERLEALLGASTTRDAELGGAARGLLGGTLDAAGALCALGALAASAPPPPAVAEELLRLMARLGRKLDLVGDDVRAGVDAAVRAGPPPPR